MRRIASKGRCHHLPTKLQNCSCSIVCFCLLVLRPKPHRHSRRKDGTMSNLEREIRLTVRVTSEEESKIKENMALTGTSNFSRYARKMLLDGYVVKIDFAELKEVSASLGQIARNTYQIAKRANEMRSIYAEDLEDIKEAYYNDFAKLKEQIVKLIKNIGK